MILKVFLKLWNQTRNYKTFRSPLHEFLPNSKEENKELLEKLNISKEELTNRIEQLNELNPMLGHRGSRLGITFPEIYRMQAKAIIEAAIEVKKEMESVQF